MDEDLNLDVKTFSSLLNNDNPSFTNQFLNNNFNNNCCEGNNKFAIFHKNKSNLFQEEKQMLNNLKKTVLNNSINTLRYIQPIECIICYEELKDRLSTTACGHVFHTLCLRKWIIEHGSCPICKNRDRTVINLHNIDLIYKEESIEYILREKQAALKNNIDINYIEMENENASLKVANESLKANLSNKISELKDIKFKFHDQEKDYNELRKRLINAEFLLSEEKLLMQKIKEKNELLETKNTKMNVRIKDSLIKEKMLSQFFTSIDFFENFHEKFDEFMTKVKEMINDEDSESKITGYIYTLHSQINELRILNKSLKDKINSNSINNKAKKFKISSSSFEIIEKSNIKVTNNNIVNNKIEKSNYNPFTIYKTINIKDFLKREKKHPNHIDNNDDKINIKNYSSINKTDYDNLEEIKEIILDDVVNNNKGINNKDIDYFDEGDNLVINNDNSFLKSFKFKNKHVVKNPEINEVNLITSEESAMDEESSISLFKNNYLNKTKMNLKNNRIEMDKKEDSLFSDEESFQNTNNNNNGCLNDLNKKINYNELDIRPDNNKNINKVNDVEKKENIIGADLIEKIQIALKEKEKDNKTNENKENNININNNEKVNFNHNEEYIDFHSKKSANFYKYNDKDYIIDNMIDTNLDAISLFNQGKKVIVENKIDLKKDNKDKITNQLNPFYVPKIDIDENLLKNKYQILDKNSNYNKTNIDTRKLADELIMKSLENKKNANVNFKGNSFPENNKVPVNKQDSMNPKNKRDKFNNLFS